MMTFRIIGMNLAHRIRFSVCSPLVSLLVDCVRERFPLSIFIITYSYPAGDPDFETVCCKGLLSKIMYNGSESLL